MPAQPAARQVYVCEYQDRTLVWRKKAVTAGSEREARAKFRRHTRNVFMLLSVTKRAD